MPEPPIDTIGEALRQQKDLAIFKLPGSRRFSGILGQSRRVCRNVRELEGRRGFLMHPFLPHPGCPVFLMEGPVREWDLPAMDLEERRAADAPGTPAEKQAYADRFHTFKQAIDEDRFQKLVLSRCKRRPRPARLDLLQIFLEACNRYPDNYVYLCSSSVTGTWMGSTPEILLSGQAAHWQTVALAGTLPCPAIPEPGRVPAIAWDEKNRGEQAYVAGYIRNALKKYPVEFSEKGPFTTLSGKLCHLKSEFDFHPVPASAGLEALFPLLEDLHPTPAVCGLPKEAARDFIRQHEGYDRRYYSGYAGYLDSSAEARLFVNLRCMEVTARDLVFYAGGGLVRESELEKEWKETENKTDTMQSLIYK